MICSTCGGTGLVTNSEDINNQQELKNSECVNCEGIGNTTIYMTNDELKEEARKTMSCYCDNEGCYYALEKAPLIEIVFQVAMDGGSLSHNLDDGFWTECPLCHENKLVLSN